MIDLNSLEINLSFTKADAKKFIFIDEVEIDMFSTVVVTFRAYSLTTP